MLNKKDLVARLKEYDFSKYPNYPDTTYERAHGLKNMFTVISTYSTFMTLNGYDEENISKINEAYGFIAGCYASIDFEELKENKDEPAVEFLFKNQNLIRNLGTYVTRFTTDCVISNKHKNKITPETPGYVDLQKTIEEITKLDHGGFYIKRIKELEKCQ